MAKTKKYTVVLLPSPNAPKDCLGMVFKNNDGVLSILKNLEDILKANQHFGAKPHHIHIISDDEIDGKMISNGKAIYLKEEDAYYKVIASSDMKIAPTCWLNSDFKEFFVRRHSSGNPIEQIELDLEPMFTRFGEKNPKNQVPKTHQNGSLFLTYNALK